MQIINITYYSLLLIYLYTHTQIINCAYQPLQLNQQVFLTYQNNQYILSYATSRTTTANVLFCFAQTYQTKSAAQNRNLNNYTQCKLNKYNNTYFCINLYSKQGAFYQYNYNKVLDPNNIVTTDNDIRGATVTTSQYQTNITNNNNNSNNSNNKLKSQSDKQIKLSQSSSIGVQLQSYALSQNLKIKNYFKHKQFYHMYTCPIWNKDTNSCEQYWKQNYIHTHTHVQKVINLIVQRYHVCGIYTDQYQQIYNHIFYGGVLRNNQYYLFFAILSYQTNSLLPLNMWGGISYSYDHANRDMFCYATDGSSFDAISLLAGPAYKDIASNINGNDDIQIVDSTYSERYPNHYMYFIQYNRPYDTGDKLGDQAIFRKIYDQFGFAAYFQNVIGTQLMYVTTYNCLQHKMHNFIFGFPADVTVWETYTLQYFGLIFTVLLFYIFYV